MSLFFFLSSLLAAGAVAQSSNSSGLPPITPSDVNTNLPENIVPVKNVSLPYGSGSALVNASFDLIHPAVLLEQVASIKAVECSDNSVDVTFNETSAFSLAVETWNADGEFVLITNHFGNCDDDFTRGFYLIQSLTINNLTLTITASSSNQSIVDLAEYAYINFNTDGSLVSKRDIVLNTSSSLSISNSFSLSDTVLYEYSPYVTVTADEAVFSAGVKFSGVLTYDFNSNSLEDLYVNIDTALNADVELTVDLDGEYSTAFSYAPTTLEYSLIDVVGILNLGPALAFSIGVELGAEGAVEVTLGAEAAITDGFVHIDALDSSNSYASGWTPTYDLSLNLTEDVKAFVDPYVSLTVELAFNLFDGLLDLSTGLTAIPGFINDLELAAEQDFDYDGGANVTVVQPSGTGCEQGLEFTSDFVFNLTAFVTEFYSATLYTVDIPLYDYCYTWA